MLLEEGSSQYYLKQLLTKMQRFFEAPIAANELEELLIRIVCRSIFESLTPSKKKGEEELMLKQRVRR